MAIFQEPFQPLSLQLYASFHSKNHRDFPDGAFLQNYQHLPYSKELVLDESRVIQYIVLSNI